MEPLIKQLPIHQPLGPEELAEAIRVITSHYRWPDMRMDASEFRKAASTLDRPYLSQILEVIYRRHMAQEGKHRWGDKTPGYIRIIPQLAQIFPGARFIHLVRDGRDVAKSFQATGWYGPWLHDNMVEWIEALDYEERWSCSQLATEMLQVRYEQLVIQPEETVRRICAFLDEAFELQMLSWQDRVARLVPEREIGIHKKLMRGPNAADAERWRWEMSAREVFVCEAFTGRHLARSGYGCKFRDAAGSQLSRCRDGTAGGCSRL